VVDVGRHLGNYRCWKMTTCKELLAIRRRHLTSITTMSTNPVSPSGSLRPESNNAFQQYGRHSMPKQPLREGALAKEGAEAILYECSIVSHVRVSQVQAQRDGVSADLAVIQTLPAGFEHLLQPFDRDDEADGSVRLDVRVPWRGVDSDYWGIAEVGMRLYLDPALVKATIAYCKHLPADESPQS